MGLSLSHSLMKSLLLPHIEVRSSGSVCQLLLVVEGRETSLLDLPGDRSLDGQVRVDTVDLSSVLINSRRRDVLGGNRSSSCDR
jgi:hypothetical protein